MLNLSESKPCC